jgi:hypothetical protein
MVTSEPPVTESEKRQALKTALESETFARSAQLRALLQYICEREMSGDAATLTEYQIAVDVLGRRKDFNLTDDSSVRNRVYELRQRLDRYYSNENSAAEVQIDIPRGGYVPFYSRRRPSAEVAREMPARELQAATFVVEAAPVVPVVDAVRRAPRERFYWAIVLIAVVCVAIGLAIGDYLGRSRPSAVLKEAWGPLADPGDEILISIATSLHMVVRPHITAHPWRFAAPPNIAEIYGNTRPLDAGTPLYMEPAQLSVPLAELAAVATLSNARTAFGGIYQILPESEAPVGALRGRNAILLATSTHSEAARALLHNMPYTIDYDAKDLFSVIDQRKPAGQNEVFTARPTGQPVPSTLYGLLSVITWPDAGGRARRTVILSGAGSAGVQAAAEFFCSPARMAELRQKMHGFPPAYQVVIRCKTSGLRLISYEYVTHEVVR